MNKTEKIIQNTNTPIRIEETINTIIAYVTDLIQFYNNLYTETHNVQYFKLAQDLQYTKTQLEIIKQKMYDVNNNSTNLPSDILGKWPGDENINQLLDALKNRR